MAKKEIQEYWNQVDVIHCPEEFCEGMLMQNKYCHGNKCSDCGKYFMLITSFEEVDEEIALQ